MDSTLYHRFLRVAALTAALMLAFESGVVVPETGPISAGARQYVASVVGVYAGVEATDTSLMTLELTQRSQELDAREAALNEREIAARDFGGGVSLSLADYVLSAVLLILILLMGLNYLLDFTRGRRIRYA
jgi:hypothetical protein